MTVYGYCRLSIDRQDSLSIETQADAIRAYCAHRFRADGAAPVFYSESGVSGGTAMVSRPEGRKLLAVLVRGDHLVVAKLDRAFRSVADASMMLGEFERAGVTLHFLDLGVDTSTPVGRLIVHVIAAVAEMERERIGERMRDSNRYRRASGRPWMGQNNCPLGWRIVGPEGAKQFEAWPEERGQCRKLLRMRQRGLTVRAVMQAAYKAGMRSLRTGKPLSWNRIRLMLHAAQDNFSIISYACRTYGSESKRGGRLDWHRRPKKSRSGEQTEKRSYGVAGLESETFGLVDGSRPKAHKRRRRKDRHPTDTEGNP